MIDPTKVSDQDVTPTLVEAVRCRADRSDASLALERPAARPAAAREEQWVGGTS